MKNKLFYSLVAVTLSSGLLSTVAFADSVTLTLNPTTTSVAPGGTATFDATISAPGMNSNPVFLNGDTVTQNGPSDLAVDDSGLFNNFPVALVPGASATDELFTVLVPSDVADGDYSGFYVLAGGADVNAENTLATDVFTLDVTSGTPAITPEPSSFALLGTGLLGVAGVMRKRFA